MEIASASRSFYQSPNSQTDRQQPAYHLSQNGSSPDSKSTSQTVNMRSISLDEINSLIRSGVDGLLDVLPITGIDINQLNGNHATSYLETQLHEKVDFLGQVEGTIEFKKSRGESTAFLQTVLQNLKQIDGTQFPNKVDLRG